MSKKVYSTEGAVKRPRRRIGEMPKWLRKEVENLPVHERIRIRVSAQFAAL